MSEWVIPVDQETGIPLAIAPSDDLPNAGDTGQGANWHHAVFPKSRKEWKSISGTALRNVRTQWIDVGDHVSYHHYFDKFMAEDWEFPKTEVDRFGMVVLLAAKYVPPEAVKVTRQGREYVDVDEAMQTRFWDDGLIKVSGEYEAFKFMSSFILGQNLGQVVEEHDIEEFLFTEDDGRRVELGNTLIDVAATIASDEVRSTYVKAYKNRLIDPRFPAEPDRFITDERFVLGTENRKRRARTSLRQRLGKDLGLDLAAGKFPLKMRHE